MQELGYEIDCFLQKNTHLKQPNQHRKRYNIPTAKVKENLIIP